MKIHLTLLFRRSLKPFQWGLICLLICSLWRCYYFDPNRNQVKVKITYLSEHPDDRLEKITAISGGDKFYWPYLSAGETETVRLWPTKNSSNQLILLYHLQGQSASWDGPKTPEGKNYRIEVVIHADGKVKTRWSSPKETEAVN